MGIQLGFVSELQDDESSSLISPIDSIRNVVGGKPIWLDPLNPLEAQICPTCSAVMPLLIQIYAPEDYPEAAFHRVLYVFCCKTGSCHKSPTSGISIWRSQMELKNNVYDMDGNYKVELSIQDDCLVQHKTLYCSLCGLKAPFRCGECKKRNYCSQFHQKIDWVQGNHRECCQSHSLPSPVVSKWLSAFLFPRLLLEEDEEPEKVVEPISKEIEEQLNKVEEGDDLLEEETETETGVDKAFLKFQKRISLASDQILRYGRVLPEGNEEPLWVASEGIPQEIPPCPHCAGPRTFEFQITPQLLSHLQLDNKDPSSLDWGTLVFYTCNNHCDGANNGKYAQEYWFRQNFSSNGMADLVQKNNNEV